MASNFEERFARATAAGREQLASPFAVVAVRYEDPPEHRLVVELQNGVAVSIPCRALEELEEASPDLLRQVIVSPLRDGLYWEAIDVAMSARGLLADMVGAVDAREAGRKGGSATTSAKAAASRENGKKGGRPPKVVGH